MPGPFDWLGDQFGSLFGATPSAPTNPLERIYGSPGSATAMVYGGAAAPYSGGLLDPAAIRRDALWQGLGALSAGLIAAGQRRPVMSPNLLPQALGAFQPAYNAALQSGYQQAALEQQARQSAQDEQLIEAYRRSNPAYANLTRAALAAQMARTPPAGFEPDPTRPGALRPISGGPESLDYRGARTAVERAPEPLHFQMVNGQLVAIDPAQVRGGTPPGTAPAATPPGSAPPVPPGTAPAAAPPGGTQGPIGVRNNNWLSWGITGGRAPAFATPEEGVARSVQQIGQLFPSGTATPAQLVQTWAQGPNYDPARASPQVRASIANYTETVRRAAGAQDANTPINLRDPATLQRVVTAMGQFETGGLPQGAEPVIQRGIAAASQPGARFTPVTPGQRAAPAPGTPAPPAAGGPALPPGVRVLAGSPPDPNQLQGTGLDQQMINMYRALDAKRTEGTLTPAEAQMLALIERQMTATRTTAEGATIVPGPLPRLSEYTSSPPAAGAQQPPPARREPPPPAPGMIRTPTADGGYVDRPAREPPTTVVTALSGNVAAIQGIDRANAALNRYEQAVGIVPYMASSTPFTQLLQDRSDPQGVEARANIANIRSTVIHDRSGASTTIGEMTNLAPFIPSVGDTPEVIRAKLANLRSALTEETGGLYAAYSPAAGFRPLEHVERALRPPAATVPPPPPPPPPSPPPSRPRAAVSPPMVNGQIDRDAIQRAGPGIHYRFPDGTTWEYVPPSADMRTPAMLREVPREVTQ